MAIIFAGANGIENRGRVAVLERPGAATLDLVTLPSWGGFSGFKSILTNIEINEQGNYQFQHTLGNEIFIYVFGDKIGTFNINGIAFYDSCESNSLAAHGIVSVMNYYRQHRIANRAAPLLVTLPPTTVLRCYLLTWRGRVVDDALRMFEFSLGMAVVPEDATDD